MNEVLIAIDIDGTLMHSRDLRGADDVCVEVINDVEHGFMSLEMIDALRHAIQISTLIPVTTRSLSQYSRINWPHGLKPEIAFVANGALMLRSDEKGRVNARPVVINDSEDYLMQLQIALARLENDRRLRDARIVDGCYAMAILKESCAGSDLENDYDDIVSMRRYIEGKKLYLFPEECNKGVAIRHLRKLYPDCRVICGGDTSNDHSMEPFSDASLFFSKDEQLDCDANSLTAQRQFEHKLAQTICEFVFDGDF